MGLDKTSEYSVMIKITQIISLNQLDIPQSRFRPYRPMSSDIALFQTERFQNAHLI